jgi:hypothetical protein
MVDGEATYGTHIASERALQEENVNKFTESDFEKRGTDYNDQKDWRFSSVGGH